MAFNQDLILLIGGDSHEAVEALNKTKEAAEKTGEAVTHYLEHGFASVVEVAALAVGAITAMTGAIIGLGVHGSEVADIEEGFHRLAGGTEHAHEVLTAMSKGVRGTIDDMKLMTDANHLLATGALSSADDFGTLTESARVLSRQGFGSMEEMINGVSRALETGRTRRLALMGVTVNAKEAEDALAKSLGIQNSDLSSSQRLMADRQAVMQSLRKTVEQAGEQELSFAERIRQVKVALGNWFDELAKGVATSPHVLDAFDAIQKAIVNAFGMDSQTLMETIITWINRFADAIAEYGPRFIQWVAEVQAEITKAIGLVRQEWDTIPDWMKNVGTNATVATAGVWALSGALGFLTGDGMIGDLKALIKTVGLLAEAFTAVKVLGFVDGLRYMVPWLNTAYVATMTWVGGLGTLGTALATAAGSFALLAAAVFGVYKMVQLGYNAWKLWHESADRAAQDARQAAIDTANLARINEKYGTSFTTIGEAAEYARKQVAGARQEHHLTAEETRQLALATDVAKHKVTDLAEAQKVILAEASKIAGKEITNLGEAMVIVGSHANRGEEQITRFTKAVDTLLQSLRGNGRNVDVVVAAFRQLTAAEREDADVIAALLPQVNKFIAAHKNIPADLRAWRDASIANRSALEDEQMSTMLATAATRERIRTLKAHGESEEQVAEDIGVTVGALTRYMAVENELDQNHQNNIKHLEDLATRIAANVKKVHDEFINGHMSNMAKSEALWTEYYDIINKRSMSSFDYQRMRIEDWRENERQSINYATDNWYDHWQAIDANAEAKLGDIAIAEKKVFDEMADEVVNFGNVVKKTLGGFPDLLQKAFTGGGGVKGAVDAMAAGVGGSIGSDAFGRVAAKLSNTFVSHFGTKATELLGSVIPGIGGVIGSLLGPLLGKLFGGPSQAELEGRKIVKSFEDQFGGFDKMMKAVGSAYDVTGKSAEQARADVERLMAAEKKGGEATKAVIADIQKQIDLQQKAMAALPKIMDDVAVGMNAIADGTVGAFVRVADALVNTGDALVPLRESEAKYQAQIDALMAKRGQLSTQQQAELAALQRKLADVQTQISLLSSQNQKAAQDFTQMGTSGQDAFDRVGRLAVTSFNAMIAGGKSFVEALAAIGPTLDTLTSAQNRFGFTSTDTLNTLLSFRTFADNNKELMASIDGVNKMMDGLNKMGLLTQQDFDDLNKTADDAFQKMVDGGVDGNVALRAMQPTLQKIWEMQHDYGMVVDENTQKILDQAEQQNIVGESMKSVQQQTLDVLKAIAKVLGADIPDAINKIPTHKTVTVDVNYNDPGAPALPGAETSPDVPSFAGRALERVTGTGYALLHPGDVVGVPKPGMFGPGAASFGVIADSIDAMHLTMETMPDIFARKIRDAIQLAG